MLQGLRAVVDVQHLYRLNHPNDRGAVFTLANGTKTSEASATLIYGAALASWLKANGADVLTNDTSRGILIGPYSRRNEEAGSWGAHTYLACHLNAGGGSYAITEHMSMALGAALAPTIGTHLMRGFPAITMARVRALSSTDRGAVCIRSVPSSVAAVICEPFFGDHPAHQPLLSATQLVRVGEAIGQAVAEWWRDRIVPS